jgi:uncharacterized repeat protein (TIGR04002 family)
MQHTKRLVLSSLFAALIFVSITFFHVPNGLGGVIHFGDALIFIAAVLLPFPYALPVAAVGAGMFNLLMAPVWLPFTIVIKPLMTLCFTSEGNTVLGPVRNIIGPFAGLTINTFLYFCANWILFTHYTAVAAAPALLIQGGGSIIFYFVIACALDRIGIKNLLAKAGLYDNSL